MRPRAAALAALGNHMRRYHDHHAIVGRTMWFKQPRRTPRREFPPAYCRLLRCSARAAATAGEGTTTTGMSACWST